MKQIKCFVCVSSLLLTSFVIGAEKEIACPEGQLAFYGKATHAGVTDKLCLITPGKGVFYTKPADEDTFVDFIATDIIRKETIGGNGRTVEYRFTVGHMGSISFKSLFKRDEPKSVMSFLNIDYDLTEINPETVYVR